MRIADAFPSKYVRAADLPAGQDVPVQIHYVQMEPMEQSDDSKPVVYFHGENKGLVLNKTNAATIGGMHGQETDGWQGKDIAIYATTTSFRGETVPCIRVRGVPPGLKPTLPARDNPTSPAQPAPAADGGPPPDDDIPF